MTDDRGKKRPAWARLDDHELGRQVPAWARLDDDDLGQSRPAWARLDNPAPEATRVASQSPGPAAGRALPPDDLSPRRQVAVPATRPEVISATDPSPSQRARRPSWFATSSASAVSYVPLVVIVLAFVMGGLSLFVVFGGRPTGDLSVDGMRPGTRSVSGKSLEQSGRLIATVGGPVEPIVKLLGPPNQRLTPYASHFGLYDWERPGQMLHVRIDGGLTILSIELKPNTD